MAVYYNLGIDCGPNESVATGVARHFEGFTVSIPDFDPALCDVTVEEQRGLWFVGVWPRGMSHNSPMWQDRRELIDGNSINSIGDQLFARLATLGGFRRAMFGAECFDSLAFASPEDDDDIDFAGMVFSIRDFPRDSADRVVSPFSDGYQIVDVQS